MFDVVYPKSKVVCSLMTWVMIRAHLGVAIGGGADRESSQWRSATRLSTSVHASFSRDDFEKHRDQAKKHVVIRYPSVRRRCFWKISNIEGSKMLQF